MKNKNTRAARRPDRPGGERFCIACTSPFAALTLKYEFARKCNPSRVIPDAATGHVSPRNLEKCEQERHLRGCSFSKHKAEDPRRWVTMPLGAGAPSGAEREVWVQGGPRYMQDARDSSPGVSVQRAQQEAKEHLKLQGRHFSSCQMSGNTFTLPAEAKVCMCLALIVSRRTGPSEGLL